MSRSIRSLAALPLAATLVLGACGNDGAGDQSNLAPAPLALSAREYSLDTGGVHTLPAGPVAVSLHNAGRQDHALQIYRLKDGVTARRFQATLRRGGDEALGPIVASVHGGVMNVPPGETWRATLTLPPGTYALEDFGETPDRSHNGRDHGMVASVRLVPSQRPAATAPPKAVSVSLTPSGCRVPSTLPRRGTLAISTEGSGFYEFAVGRVAPGSAERELRKLHDGDDETFPNVEPVDLLSAMGGGQTAYVSVDLRPGPYVVVCFSGQPGSDSPAIHGSTAIVR